MTMADIELRYLGTAGWYLRTAGQGLLLDPFFTRLPMWRAVAGRARPARQIIETRTPPADWIFVTHAHYDHIMDVPDAAAFTGADVYASQQSCDLLRILGMPGSQVHVIRDGEQIICGPYTVEVHVSRHRTIFGRIPYQGRLRRGLVPPLRARDYRIDVQYSLRIGVGGVTILVTSGVDDEPAVRSDVLIVGADAGQARLNPILKGVQPRLVLPNHWDDMFRPLSKPVRPMRVPPQGIIPSLKRIDLAAFTAQVRQAWPAARVLLPDLFTPYRLAEWL